MIAHSSNCFIIGKNWRCSLIFVCFESDEVARYQVYKENLVETILPSIQSVMTAVLHYKKMGGEANLYINDDGLQV